MVFNNRARELLKKVSDAEALLHDWLAYQVISAAGGIVLYDSHPSLKYRQHGENLIGSNLGLRARARRIKMLFEGQWRDWNELNFQALKLLGMEITEQNRRTIENLNQSRAANWFLQRVWYFMRSGVYRQTFAGNLGLWIAVLMRKM